MYTTNGKLQLYPFLRLSFFLIVGIVMGKTLNEEIYPRIWLLLSVFSLSVYSVLHYFKAHLFGDTAMTNTILVFVTTMLLGAFCESVKYRNSIVSLPDEMATYNGVVVSKPVCHGKVVQMDVIITDGELVGRKIKTSILLDNADVLAIGDGIEFVSRLEKPHNFVSNFDYKSYLILHDYVAEAFVFGDNFLKCKSNQSNLNVLTRCIIRFRKLRNLLINNYMTSHRNSDDVFAVTSALALGDKSVLSNRLKKDYSISGASHVLALSGLHLGIIYSFLLMFVGHRNKLWKQVMVLLVVWTFVFLVGLSQSVVRSAFMLSVYSILSLMKRDKLSLNTWALVLFFMLVCNPWSLFDVGMQMSFISVLSILVYYRRLKDLFHPSFKITKMLWSMTVVSISAQLGVAPLVIFYFHRFSTLFLLTNFVVIPLTFLILYAVLFSFLLAIIPIIHTFLLGTAYHLVDIMNKFVEWEASLCFSSIENINISVLQLFGIYLFLICVTILLFNLPHRIVRNMYPALGDKE